MSTLIYFDGEAYWGQNSTSPAPQPERIQKLFLVLRAPLVKEDRVQEIDTGLRLHVIHETCYYLAEEPGEKTRLFDASCHYILQADEAFTSDALFLPPGSCLEPFADKGIRYWGSTWDFHYYHFFFVTQTKEWLVVNGNRVVVTTRSPLILFWIARYRRVAVIGYPDVLTDVISYGTTTFNLQCLVNDWASSGNATIQFTPVGGSNFIAPLECVTAHVGRFFEFDESVSFLIEYSERLFEDEYSFKQGILITYSFRRDEGSPVIYDSLSSIQTNTEPDEVTPEAVIFKGDMKTAYDRRTGRLLCQARLDADYSIMQHRGLYDFKNKKVLLESAYADIVEAKAFPFTAFIVTASNLRKGMARLEYGITTPAELLLPPCYSRLDNIPYKPQNPGGEIACVSPPRVFRKALKPLFSLKTTACTSWG